MEVADTQGGFRHFELSGSIGSDEDGFSRLNEGGQVGLQFWRRRQPCEPAIERAVKNTRVGKRQIGDGRFEIPSFKTCAGEEVPCGSYGLIRRVGVGANEGQCRVGRGLEPKDGASLKNFSYCDGGPTF